MKLIFQFKSKDNGEANDTHGRWHGVVDKKKQNKGGNGQHEQK